MRNKYLIVISGCFVFCWWVGVAMGADAGPSVVLHFDTGQAHLHAAQKTKLRRLFQTYDVSGAGRVFVLGFTDNQGTQEGNYELSRRRAQSVRREIISSFGIDATVVMALGKGYENPVADNGRRKGRAQNRRAEIYLANAAVRRPKRVYGPDDPHLPAITTWVEAADAEVRAHHFDQALKKLHQASAIGGDHYSDWHTVMGIVGFYTGGPAAKTKAHLTTAIKLDPYNFKAREFLSRVDARHLVSQNKITPQMGHSAEDAIPVTSVVQSHEYLKLFKVEPMARSELEGRPIEVWDCRDAKGNTVTYYFNQSPVYAWAYPNKVSSPMYPSGPDPQPLDTDKAPPIWESQIFK